MTFRNRTTLAALLLAVLLVTVGCVTPRIGEKWPALSVMTVEGRTAIVVAYTDRIELLNPATGRPVELLNTEGDVRRDEQGNARVWRVNGSDAENAQFFAQPIAITDPESGEESLLFASLNEAIFPVDAFTARIDTLGIDLNGAMLAQPAVDDSSFYVPYKFGGVEALNRSTYDITWRFDTLEGVWATPLLDNGTLYIPSVDHFVYAVDSETGQERWRANLEGGVVATPLLYEDHLYVGSFARKLFKISLSGDIVGEYAAQNWVWGAPVVYDGTLYVADLAGYVHAIDPNTMQAEWSIQIAERGIRPSPLVTEDYVVVASRDGRVYWINRTGGTRAFQAEVEGRPEILSDLVLVRSEDVVGVTGVVEDIVIVGTVDLGRMVAAFRLDDGRLNWTYRR